MSFMFKEQLSKIKSLKGEFKSKKITLTEFWKKIEDILR